MGDVIGFAQAIKRRLKVIERLGISVYLETPEGPRYARLLLCKDEHLEYTDATGGRWACDYDLILRANSSIQMRKRKSEVIAFPCRQRRMISIRGGHSDLSA